MEVELQPSFYLHENKPTKDGKQLEEQVGICKALMVHALFIPEISNLVSCFKFVHWNVRVHISIYANV